MTIRNPGEWGRDQYLHWTRALGQAGHAVHHGSENPSALLPAIRPIGARDLREALAKGMQDFVSNRTDVIFVCLMYPVIGLILARAAFGQDMFHLLFPLASGFALIGPFAAVGLYEMSRRRERGESATWRQALGVLGSPEAGAIFTLGLVLTIIFLAWLVAAEMIYTLTLGPVPPATIGAFVHDLFTTGGGLALIVVGVGVGFLFAVLALAVSVVSFPLLIDRKVGVATAIWTSIHVVRANPGTMALWGLIVAASLVLGSIPLFVGLTVVMPVLGHATWHLYRKAVAR